MQHLLLFVEQVSVAYALSSNFYYNSISFRGKKETFLIVSPVLFFVSLSMIFFLWTSKILHPTRQHSLHRRLSKPKRKNVYTCNHLCTGRKMLFAREMFRIISSYFYVLHFILHSHIVLFVTAGDCIHNRKWHQKKTKKKTLTHACSRPSPIQIEYIYLPT